ncbi:MAG TPA: NAD-dependent dehydratase, partial [Chloroflexi bacterium]|nr:NAD-dependent dehydratase [Chloroflexota bacterium]
MSYWNGKRVLVTGGTGFIGSHCVERLLEHGAHVRVIGRNRQSFQKHLRSVEQDVDFQVGDLTDVVAIDRAVADQDMLIHLAAFVA